MSLRSPHIARTVGALLAVSGAALAGTPFPTKHTPAPLDLGALAPAEETSDISVTLPLKLRNLEDAQALLQSISDRSSANFHQFLTTQEFKAKFGPSDDDVGAITAYFAAHDLTAVRAGTTTLRVTGKLAAMERVFQVTLHQYEVPAQANAEAYRFRAPTSTPKVPAEVSALVQGVVGLNTRPKFFPHNIKVAAAAPPLSGIKETGKSSGLINPFGSLTVADFAKYYDVLPLQAKNITGEGRTMAIVTLAGFTPSDVFKYWKSLGLKVSSNRLTVINVDGGPGAPSDASGSDETTLDVEQSGGIAPGAAIRVYQAPNTDQAFLDAFVHAIDTNKADSISTSWGEWEWYDDVANGPVTDPYTGKSVSGLKALHEVLLQAALQGQSVFAAAGDAGAYDANDQATPPDYSLALSVDNPASDSFITAAGGTTLAGPQSFALPKGTFNVTISHERVWSWDYLVPLCTDLGYDPIACGIFPVGGGGGVSFEYGLPFYQEGVVGIQKTQPDQVFIDEDTVPPSTVLDLPAHYAGRNVPDVSFNADPDTGYVVFYTSDKTGYSESTFWGGTSFVAPQLNGVVGLIGQYVHGRLGLFNVPLYQLVKSGEAYSGKAAPLNVIKYGNNDYYYGRDGYGPAAGVGTLDVANFAEFLKADH
jgi:subtilase family serine protease